MLSPMTFSPRQFIFVVACLLGSLSISALAADVTLTINPNNIIRDIPPGAIGWGAMWKRQFLHPTPGPITSDADHAAYIEQLAQVGAPLAKAADLRNISWPWGVTFSTWGVNWENSIGPWWQRPRDCARQVFLNKGSGWCEKTIVGVGDLLTLANRWKLEAVTVAVPLAVFDGNQPRYGPDVWSPAVSDTVIERIADHAARLVAFMQTHPAWTGLQRVYLSAGCEWRHYGWINPSPAVLTYAKLIKRMREKIPDPKVIIVASASDSADTEAFKAATWNYFLYEALKNTPGVALDLHRYRGMRELDAAPDGSTAPTFANVERLIQTGKSQRDYLTVHPGQWQIPGLPIEPAMASVLLENAIHGLVSDHSTFSTSPHPWPVVLAHADLVREALASPALTFLGWTWFPEDVPQEWPHGAIQRDGTLSRHAQAQAFLSRYHRGVLLEATIDDGTALRANVTRTEEGTLHVSGGNFSLHPQTLHVMIKDIHANEATLEVLIPSGIHTLSWSIQSPLTLPPMTLWRLSLEPLK